MTAAFSRPFLLAALLALAALVPIVISRRGERVKAAPIVVSAVIAASLVGAYVALGGTSYEPSPVADPCMPRPPRDTGDTGSGWSLCCSPRRRYCMRLGVSREELVLALRSVDELDALAEREGRSATSWRMRSAPGWCVPWKRGREELIGSTTAGVLRFAAERLRSGSSSRCSAARRRSSTEPK